MVPPPALTVLMSIIGTAMSRPSILPRLAIDRLAVADQRHVAGRAAHVEGDEVGGVPATRPAATPAVTPPAGPDSTVVTALRAAAAKVDMPPFDCMMYFCGVATPVALRRRSRLAM